MLRKDKPKFKGIDGWLALDLTPKVGRKTIFKLLEEFGTPEAIWDNLNELKARCSWLRPSAYEALIQGPDRKLLELHKKFLTNSKNWIITIADSAYPPLLTNISDPPLILYGKGDLESLKGPAVAIVGSRAATQYGKEAAKHIAAGLVSKGITVVSGLALGIDSIAHKSAIASGGKTIAVKGCGVDYPYPRQNVSLATSIAQNGAVISEYPLGMRPDAGLFPVRNRIISGLCLAVVVIEGTKRSGSLITAHLALEQGREVGAVPGSIFSNLSAGPHALIQSGAKLVTTAEDIVEEISFACDPLTQNNLEQFNGAESVVADVTINLTSEEKKLLEIITSYPQHINEIAYAAGLEPQAASGLLLQLELKDLIQSLPGQNYIRR